MNKQYKRAKKKLWGLFWGITLLLSFLLSGCSDKENESDKTMSEENSSNKAQETDRYVQQEIGLPESILQTSYIIVGFIQAENLELFLYNQDDSKYEKYILSQSFQWESSPCEWLNSILQGIYPASVDVLYREGTYYAKYEGKDGKCYLIKSDDEKNIVEVPLERWNRQDGQEYYPVVDQIAVLEDSTVVSTLKNSICQIHRDGEAVGEFNCGEPYSLAGYGKYAVAIDEGNTGVCVYNINSMEKEYEIRFADLNGNIPQLFMKDETAIYMAGDIGLKEWKLDSGETQLIINGSQTMFSYGGYFPLWLEKTPEEAFYVLFTERERTNARLMKYSRNTGEIDNRNKTGNSDNKAQGDQLVIYSLQDNELIRSAINNFKVKYPSANIFYEVARSENGASTDSDLIRALNARIEAGNGPDILVLDGMPMDSYIEKGILADISGILSESDVAANILKAYEHDGMIYAVPTRIGLPVIIGTDDVIAKADDLNKLASYSNQAKLPYYIEGTVTYNTLIENFYPLCINSIIENEKVNQIKLKEFLSNIKIIADSVGAVEASDFDNSRPVRWLGLGNTSFAIAIIRGMLYDQATEVLSYAKQNGDYVAVDNLFMSYGLLGINENGGQKELAEQFVMEALDMQVQRIEYLGAGFPVTNSALKIWKDEESDRGGAVSDPGTGSYIAFDWPDKVMRERLFREISEVETPILQDGIVKEKLMTIGEQYLRGGITIEAAVQEITDEVEVYIQE